MQSFDAAGVQTVLMGIEAGQLITTCLDWASAELGFNKFRRSADPTSNALDGMTIS